MRRRCILLGLFVGTLLGPQFSNAQYTANFQTNIISGVASNWAGNYNVGDTTFADVLQIQNAGILAITGNGFGYVGKTISGSNNSVVVTGLDQFGVTRVYSSGCRVWAIALSSVTAGK